MATNSTEIFGENRGFLETGLGGIAVGLLAFGVFVQQFNYRYGLRNVDFTGQPSFNRRVWKKRGQIYGQRKPVFPGYGLYSAASTVYKTISGKCAI